MGTRLLIILSLLLQPMLSAVGDASCRAPDFADQPASCCQIATSCCSSSSADASGHHCGRPASLCQCGVPRPAEPTPPPPTSQRAGHSLTAVLPHLITMMAAPAQPQALRFPPPAAILAPSSADRCALLCIWLT